ncbi:hypothetical protein F5H01DRAFT_378271 [Linnemannia elongata]|nr:hypothetical protein F5H01DRAFT_378271 [Linnemannia elongata]
MLLIKTVALLCSATAVMAATAVVSGAIFVGEDTTEYNDSPADIFRVPENHAAAAASILVFSANSVNFHPASQEPKALGQTLDAFIQKASTFPGFVLEYFKEESLALNGTLIQFEELIRKQLDDPLIARGLRDLIPGYIQDQSVTEWILSLVVVNKLENSDAVDLQFARVPLTIHSDKTQTAYIPEQNARITLAGYKTNTAFLSSNADRLAQSIKITSVPSFIVYFASPKVFSENEQTQYGSTSCSQSRPIFKNRQTVMSWLF